MKHEQKNNSIQINYNSKNKRFDDSEGLNQIHLYCQVEPRDHGKRYNYYDFKKLPIPVIFPVSLQYNG